MYILIDILLNLRLGVRSRKYRSLSFDCCHCDSYDILNPVSNQSYKRICIEICTCVVYRTAVDLDFASYVCYALKARQSCYSGTCVSAVKFNCLNRSVADFTVFLFENAECNGCSFWPLCILPVFLNLNLSCIRFNCYYIGLRCRVWLVSSVFNSKYALVGHTFMRFISAQNGSVVCDVLPAIGICIHVADFCTESFKGFNAAIIVFDASIESNLHPISASSTQAGLSVNCNGQC